MIFGSVCSGIEATSVAWQLLSWRCSFVSEIEPFPRAVLKYRLWAGDTMGPALHGDFTTIEDGQYEPIELLVGGTPCQSFSVAGLRGGMDDERGNLALEYLRLAQRLRPRWLVWENVPGVLSSNGGRDFGSILGGLGELGYGFAYRVLDAQYCRVGGFARAVPQRRRRVFVVGYLGDWRRAAAVLFERESLSGNPPPRREAGQRIAPTLAGGAGRAGLGTDAELDGALIAMSFHGAQDPDPSGAVTHPLGRNQGREVCVLQEQAAVRRLTPRECERLQGFPDDFTKIPWRGKEPDQCPDGPRYKALGNSMAVNVMRWIGQRIDMADKLEAVS